MMAEEIAATPRRPKLAAGVSDALRAGIGRGEYRAGSKLPTEGQMTAIFGVSRKNEARRRRGEGSVMRFWGDHLLFWGG